MLSNFKEAWRQLRCILFPMTADAATKMLFDTMGVTATDRFYDQISWIRPETRSKYWVERMRHYKEAEGACHEYVVVDVVTDQPAPWPRKFLILERDTEHDVSWLRTTSTAFRSGASSGSNGSSISSALPADPAYDLVLCRNKYGLKALNAARKASAVREYRNTVGFPLLELSRIAMIIKTEFPDYIIANNSCYSFAYTLTMVAKKIFAMTEQNIPNQNAALAGTLVADMGRNTSQSPNAVEIVEKAYKEHQQKYPNPLHPDVQERLQALQERVQAMNDEITELKKEKAQLQGASPPNDWASPSAEASQRLRN